MATGALVGSTWRTTSPGKSVATHSQRPWHHQPPLTLLGRLTGRTAVPTTQQQTQHNAFPRHKRPARRAWRSPHHSKHDGVSASTALPRRPQAWLCYARSAVRLRPARRSHSAGRPPLCWTHAHALGFRAHRRVAATLTLLHPLRTGHRHRCVNIGQQRCKHLWVIRHACTHRVKQPHAVCVLHGALFRLRG